MEIIFLKFVVAIPKRITSEHLKRNAQIISCFSKQIIKIGFINGAIKIYVVYLPQIIWYK